MARKLFQGLFLFLPLLLSFPTDAQAGGNAPRTLLALNVFDLNLDIDTTMDIGGETRFFSSRPNRYIGGRIMIHSGGPKEDTFFVGWFTGAAWGKSSYYLNWEEPGLQSFDPLESSISTFSWPVGVDFNFQIAGILSIAPYASAKFLWHRLSIEIANEDFSGSAIKLGLAAGCKLSIKVGSVAIAGGASLTHIVNDEIEFEVEDLTFDSHTTGSSPEYFLGVEL